MNEPLTAITTLLGRAHDTIDVPDELRRCLAEMASHVKHLADAWHDLVDDVDASPASARWSAPVVGPGRQALSPGQRLVGVAEAEPSAGREEVRGDFWALDPDLAAQLVERLQPSGTARPDQLARLTPQERRIFTLIGQGCTNRQIAHQLFLAEKTVKNYVSNMLRKLGMERRTQAAVFASALDRREVPVTPGTSRSA